MTQVSDKPREHRSLRSSREDRIPDGGAVVPWEQRQMFALLFDDEGQGAGSGTSPANNKAAGDIARIEALIEQVVPRFHGGSPWPLNAVLYVPRLGRINARIQREQSGWNVELEAEQEATSRWLQGVRQQCEQRLAASQDLPVTLHLASSAWA